MIQQLYYYYTFKVMLKGWRRSTMYSDISWMIRFLVKSVLQFRQEITVTCMLLKLIAKNRSKIIFMILLSASIAHICWEWPSPHAQWVSLPPFRKVVLTHVLDTRSFFDILNFRYFSARKLIIDLILIENSANGKFDLRSKFSSSFKTLILWQVFLSS